MDFSVRTWEEISQKWTTNRANHLTNPFSDVSPITALRLYSTQQLQVKGFNEERIDCTLKEYSLHLKTHDYAENRFLMRDRKKP